MFHRYNNNHKKWNRVELNAIYCLFLQDNKNYYQSITSNNNNEIKWNGYEVHKVET